MIRELVRSGLEFVDPDEEIQVNRESMVAAIKSLGGPDLSSRRATNDQLVATLNTLLYPRLNTIAEVDAELTTFISMSRRSDLLVRRNELGRELGLIRC